MYKKSMGKDAHKQKYTEHTWFRECNVKLSLYVYLPLRNVTT